MIGGAKVWAWYGTGIFYFKRLVTTGYVLISITGVFKLSLLSKSELEGILGWKIGVLCNCEADITFNAYYYTVFAFKRSPLDLIEERSTS